MTSNAGVVDKPKHLGFGASQAVEEANILDSLGSFFKPEFLNRFDNIVEFKSLEKEHLLEIVDLLLAELTTALTDQQLTIDITPEVKEKIAELGYHPAFGARPLRRVIQEQLEDQIADLILDHPESKHLKAVMEDEKIAIQSV
jgi:ATP-dependent Clp protease ATP-binding subunit ClpE